MHPDPAPSPGDQDCPQGQPRQLLCSQKPPTATLLDLNPFFSLSRYKGRSWRQDQICWDHFLSLSSYP